LVVAILLANSASVLPGSLANAGHAAGPLRTPPPTPDRASGGALVVARVHFDSRAERDWLAHNFDAAEAANTQAGYVVLLLRPEEAASLRQGGYRVEVDADKTLLLNQPLSAISQASGIAGYECYRTVEETYAAMAQLGASHPGLAQWQSIGQTWQRETGGPAAGYEVGVLVLTNSAVPGPKPVFFLMGAMHAREYATAELAARFAEHLVAGYGADPDITWLLDHFEVHVLPQANPDGRKVAEAGYYQRKNLNDNGGIDCASPPGILNHFGVDLNRNSSYGWGGVGSSSNYCDQTYRGATAASEPETRAVQDYAAAIFANQHGLGGAAPADASGVFISLHSYGRYVLYPWSGAHEPAPNQAGLAALGSKFGFFNGYEVCQAAVCLYQASGTIDDWIYAELGVPAFTFELGTWFFEACHDFESTVLPGNMPALIYAFKAARRPYQAPAGPDSLQPELSAAIVFAGQPVTLTAMADDTRRASGGWGAQPSQTIAAGRFTIGLPSWAPGAEAHSLSAQDGAFDSPVETLQAVIDTAGLAPGRHLVFVESQDAASNWGVPSAVFLTVEPTAFAASLSPEISLVVGEPGQAVTHTLLVTNTGTSAADFTLHIEPGPWPAAAPSSTGLLQPGQGGSISVSVVISETAAPGAHSLTGLALGIAGADASLATAALITAAHGDYGLAVVPAISSQAASPGASAAHPMRLVAIGVLTDTYAVSLAGGAWAASAPEILGPAAQGDIVPFTVTVAVPAGAVNGQINESVLTLTSLGQPGQTASAALTTAAVWARHYMPMIFIQP
jgi:carboxypeptidase T